MSKYSEKELLLLSNFAYLDASCEEGSLQEILNRYKDAAGNFTIETVRPIASSGGVDDEQKVILLSKMQEYINEKPEFGELSKARSINEGGIRGICYTDSSDQNPVLVFRGTGGSKEAWSDDMVGGVVSDTKMQKLASDFVNYECANYKNITVTGHSKGGNLAQYVTVKCSDRIDKCISYDGQGFNDEFVANNAKEIAIAKGKIKSISAYNDFVNILLNPIAGTSEYVNNDYKGANAHSSMCLLMSSQYDSKGTIISKKEQSDVTKALKSIADDVASAIGEGDKETGVKFGVFAGCLIASVLDVDSFEKGAKLAAGTVADITGALNDKISDVIGRLFDDAPTLKYQSLYISEVGIQRSAAQLNDGQNRVNVIREKVLQISGEIDYSLASKIYVDISLERVSDRLKRISNNMCFMSEELEIITSKYEQKEAAIATHFQT